MKNALAASIHAGLVTMRPSRGKMFFRLEGKPERRKNFWKRDGAGSSGVPRMESKSGVRAGWLWTEQFEKRPAKRGQTKEKQ